MKFLVGTCPIQSTIRIKLLQTLLDRILWYIASLTLLGLLRSLLWTLTMFGTWSKPRPHNCLQNPHDNLRNGISWTDPLEEDTPIRFGNRLTCHRSSLQIEKPIQLGLNIVTPTSTAITIWTTLASDLLIHSIRHERRTHSQNIL